MPVVRNCLLIAAVVLVGIALPTPSLPNGALERTTGCESVLVHDVLVDSQVVLDVRASGCRDHDGTTPTLNAISDRIGRAVWTSLTSPVDALQVMADDANGAGSSATMVIDQAELSSRFGRGPAGVVWPTTDLDGGSERIWVALPLGFAAVAFGATVLTFRLRRAGIGLILCRR